MGKEWDDSGREKVGGDGPGPHAPCPTGIPLPEPVAYPGLTGPAWAPGLPLLKMVPWGGLMGEHHQSPRHAQHLSSVTFERCAWDVFG